jgi:YXWGXW repeat-containing protein
MAALAADSIGMTLVTGKAPRGMEANAMAQWLIFAGAGLAPLLAAAPGLASAQPIDFLAPVGSARPGDMPSSDTRRPISPAAPVPSTTSPASPPVARPAPPVTQPTATYALLPGHWQLEGAQYLWVSPETVPRPVEYRPFIQGHYAWRDGQWVWVPPRWGE